MAKTERFSITLTPELAALVEARVRSGQYASDSEVIRDGLRLLDARDRAVESWLKKEVVPAIGRAQEDRSRLISGDDFDRQMEQRRKARASKAA